MKIAFFFPAIDPPFIKSKVKVPIIKKLKTKAKHTTNIPISPWINFISIPSKSKRNTCFNTVKRMFCRNILSYKFIFFFFFFILFFIICVIFFIFSLFLFFFFSNNKIVGIFTSVFFNKKPDMCKKITFFYLKIPRRVYIKRIRQRTLYKIKILIEARIFFIVFAPFCYSFFF